MFQGLVGGSKDVLGGMIRGGQEWILNLNVGKGNGFVGHGFVRVFERQNVIVFFVRDEVFRIVVNGRQRGNGSRGYLGDLRDDGVCNGSLSHGLSGVDPSGGVTSNQRSFDGDISLFGDGVKTHGIT